ncbi:porin [Piscinibacter sp.]|uniref:porin n=1 Tax=Piscinibacter sp. TaxID=1903157 RepID=UPI003782E3A5
MRLVTIALLALLALVHAELWFGKGGVPRVMELSGKLAEQKKVNEAGRQRNAQLLAEVSDLKEGLEMVEEKARFDLGMVKPIFYYAKSKVGAGGNLSNKVYSLAATAPLGNGVLKAGYTRLSLDSGWGVAEDKLTKLGLGYNYNLSKRTNLYFDLGSASGAASLATAAPGNKGERSTAYAIGLRHQF